MKKLMILCVVILPLLGSGQQDFSKVEITAQKLTEQVHVLFGAGGNIGVITGEDGVLIIDDQYAPLSDKIKAAINDISPGEIKYVVNTHWHGDHTGGNEAFGSSGASIVAHENVRKRMSTDQFIEALQWEVPASPEQAWPVITFSEDINLYFNDEDIMIFHVHHAHTDGDAMIYMASNNVLHTGDCFFNTFFPFIDQSSGGSIDGIIKALSTALMLADENTIIIPGHGPIADKDDLTVYLSMLHTMRDKVKTAISEGKSLEECKQIELTPELENYGRGFINKPTFIGFLYNDLTSKN